LVVHFDPETSFVKSADQVGRRGVRWCRLSASLNIADNDLLKSLASESGPKRKIPLSRDGPGQSARFRNIPVSCAFRGTLVEVADWFPSKQKDLTR
jgi:hypothetical protein